MKKFLKSFLVLVLCFCTCLTFVGCNNSTWSETTNETKNMVSNGGVVLYHDGWIYFVNGTKEISEAVNNGNNTQAGIYRVKATDGTIDYLKNDKGEETKSFEKIEPVVKKLVGFGKGSIFIFGDYLYYTTPSDKKNDDGEMLTGKTEFRRYDLVNKGDQLLYTTKASDDTVTFTYYKQGTSLYLVVYEKTSAILTSVKIGKEPTTVFTKEEVKSAVMSETQGVTTAVGDFANLYVYYTLDYAEDADIKRGNRVFKIKPDGTKEQLISEGDNISLLSVKAGALIFSDDSKAVYAQKIVDGEETLSKQNVVCQKTYDNIIFLNEGGNVVALVYDNTTIRKLVFTDGEFDSKNNIYEFDKNDKVKFIGVDGDYVIYQLSSLVYKIKYNVADGEENYPIKLSTTKIDDAKDAMAPEIMDGYVYGFYTDTSAKVTYMYRIRIQTPKEAGELDEDNNPKEVGEAEFVGVKE